MRLVLLALLLFAMISSAWYHVDWDYRAACEVNTTVSSSLSDFPVHCIIDTETLINEAKLQADCDDLRAVADDDTTLLDYEIENCDATTTVIWARLDTTTAGGNDSLYIYYGNAIAIDAQDEVNVWRPAGYVGVWHFSDLSSWDDSAGYNDLTITNSGNCNLLSQKYGYGVNITGVDGTLCYGNKAFPVGLPYGDADRTLSLWLNATDAGGVSNWRCAVSYGSAGSLEDNSFCVRGAVVEIGDNWSASHYGNDIVSDIATEFGTLRHAAITYNGATENMSRDGVLEYSVAQSSLSTTASVLRFGSFNYDTANAYNGFIDEVRIRNSTSTAEWITAEYAQTDALGDEEGQPNDISSCPYTISDSGTYDITGNLSATDTCITVEASDVVINGHGYTITGDDGTSDYGVYVSGRTDVTIKNTKFVDFGNAVRFSNTNLSVIQNNTAQSSSGGAIALNPGSCNNTITQNILNDSVNMAVSLQSSSNYNNITLNTITDARSGSGCIYLQTASSYNWVDHNNISDCSANGIYAEGSTITGNNYTNNIIHDFGVGGSNGILVRTGDPANTLIENNTIYGPGRAGVSVSNSGSFVTANNNTIHDTTYGLYIGITAAADDLLFYKNTFYNIGTGVYIAVPVTNVTLTNNTIYNATTFYTSNQSGSTVNFFNTTFSYNSSIGQAMWPAFDLTDQTITEGTNIYIQPDFISVDDTALAELNEPANLTLETDYLCIQTYVYEKTGFPESKAEVLDGGVVDTADCTDGVATFSVSGFSGYALSYNTSISTAIADAYETENRTLYINASASPYQITAYWLAYHYNNTQFMVNETGLTNNTLEFALPVVAPLVSVNETEIPYNVSIIMLGDGGGNITANDAGVQTVLLNYFPAAYTFPAWAETTEEPRNITVTGPVKPALAPENVSYVFDTITSATCTRHYANGTEVNASCGNTNSGIDADTFSIGASHLLVDGLIWQDYFINATYNLSFDATPESTSSKQINLSAGNLSRENFIWLVNRTNGSINGASGISTLFYITFYDELTLGALNIDSAAETFTAHFSDGQNKNFSISYTGTVQNATIRAYPDTYTGEISSSESYAKSTYTTRNRFMVHASTPFDTQQNISIYLLPSGSAEYAIINVVDRGEAVQNAYINILKFYANSSTYTHVDTKITNSEGRAATYIEAISYYKFVVYDSEGTQLYYSIGPEQFICSGTCELTIDISSQNPITLSSPYANSSCYGNESTNSIVFAYNDPTGLTTSINFLAYREGASNPVCNYTLSASSSSYVCALSNPENLSAYLYSCEVWRTASPSWLEYIALIDFRTIFGETDWFFPAVGLVIVLGFVNIGLAGISVFVLSLLNVISIPVGVSIPIMIVGLILAFLLSKRGND